jgi:opacity protein-like surface antigen
MEISKNLCSILLSSSVCLPLLSFSSATSADPSKGHFEAQAQAGIAFGHASDLSHLGITYIEDNDKLNVEDQLTAFEGAVGIGYVWPLNCKSKCKSLVWFPDAKLAVNAYGFEGDIKGDVWQFGLADLNNFDYEVDITSYRLMLDGSLSVLSWKKWSWFVLGGIGESWNRLSYQHRPNNSDIPADSGITLDPHWDTTFAWEVGTGIKYDITQRLGLSLTYLFTDLGKLKLSDDGHAGPDVEPEDLNLEGPEFDFNLQSILLGVEWAF